MKRLIIALGFIALTSLSSCFVGARAGKHTGVGVQVG